MGTQANVVQNSERAVQEGQKLTRSSNLAGTMLIDYSQDANLNRKPDHMVYVYSIVNRRFERHRPPSFPLIVFEPCPEDQEYKLAGAFPSPVNESVWMEDRNFNVGMYGKQFVRGLLNPSGTDVDRPNAGEASWSGATTDLTRRGLFMSLNHPPKPEEVQECRRKLEKHLRWLLQNGDELDRNNRRREIGPEHHAAAEYFSYKANWHYTQTAPTPCPSCGEMVRPGLAYHMNAMNQACILDWKRAVAAGVKKAAEVPADQRWEGFTLEKPASQRVSKPASQPTGAEIEIDAPAPELDLTGE